jgi:hypothetical protein
VVQYEQEEIRQLHVPARLSAEEHIMRKEQVDSCAEAA